MAVKNKTEVVRKVSSLINGEVYFTCNSWPTKEIDGNTFISIKRKPNDNTSFWIKKDQVKNV